MLYVALGRNVGDVPMEADVWESFSQMVEECVMHEEVLATADTNAVGMSRFGDMSEETRVLVWFDKDTPLKRTTVARLSAIAYTYGQEAIAWSVAPTNFTGGV